MTKEFYQTLGVDEKATPENIKKYYRELAQKWHPDKWSGKNLKEREKANEMMQKINRAYEILGDTEKRKKYDLGLTVFPTDDFSFQYDPKEEVRKQEEELKRKEINIIDLELEILKLEMKALDRSSTLTEIGAAFCFTLPRVHAEDLNPILWQPYQSWGEKVVKMEINIPEGKDRSEELKNFKEEMVKAIKEAEVTVRIRKENKKKSEEDSELNQARTAAFGYIEKEMNEKGLKDQDLGEYSNYRERINSLGEVWYIRNFREEVLGFILKLPRGGSNTGGGTTESAKEREEREKREEEERKQKEKNEAGEKDKAAKEQARQQELKQKREKVIAEINSALNQEPKLTNSELSPEYQNWEAQINQLTDLQLITNLQDRLLADIQARQHDKKTAQKVKENLNKARTGTKEEKEQAWKDLEEQETEKSYQENKAEAENLKKEKAAENPQEYSEEAKQKIEKKLKNNEVKEDELSNENQAEWQKLKNGEIKDPTKLVEIETKIAQNIYQKGAERKVADLTSRVNQVLKSKSDNQIAALKKELLEFISSSNIYYATHQKEVGNLLAKLESYSNVNNEQNISKNPKNFPWKVVIPFLLIGLSIILVIPLVRKRIKTKKKTK